MDDRPPYESPAPGMEAMGWWMDGYIPLGKLLLIGMRFTPVSTSRRWLRSFSSRRHFARRFENQTYVTHRIVIKQNSN